MIVVDSSVWIAHLRNSGSKAARALRALPHPDEILIGDLILLEVLQGARSEQHAAEIETTIYKTIDLIIATFCIERDHQLLHEDRDFDRIAAHLNLRTM